MNHESTPWTAEEMKAVKYFTFMGIATSDIAFRMKRTIPSVVAVKNKLGLSDKPTSYFSFKEILSDVDMLIIGIDEKNMVKNLLKRAYILGKIFEREQLRNEKLRERVDLALKDKIISNNMTIIKDN